MKLSHFLALTLGISGAWLAALPSARAEEAATNDFPEVKDLPIRPEMPDALTLNSGAKVTTLEQWRERREEMKAILEHYELGHAPPPPGNVSGEDLQSRPVLDGAATYRLVHLKFGPGETLGFDIAIFTPTNSGPFPTIINPSFFMTPGVNFTNGLVAPASGPVPTNSTGQLRLNLSRPVDPEKAARGFTNLLTAVTPLSPIAIPNAARTTRISALELILSRLSGLRLGRAAGLGVGACRAAWIFWRSSRSRTKRNSSRWAIRGWASW